MHGSVADSIGEIWVDGMQLGTAQGRLGYVVGLVTLRRDALDRLGRESNGAASITGAPFRVNVRGDLYALLYDDECRAALEFVAEHGERCGVVVLLYGSPDLITHAIALRSDTLTAAYAEGKVLRHVTDFGADLVGDTAATAAAAALLTAGRRVAACSNPAALALALDATFAAADDAGAARRDLAVALHRTATLLDAAA